MLLSNSAINQSNIEQQLRATAGFLFSIQIENAGIESKPHVIPSTESLTQLLIWLTMKWISLEQF